MDRRIRVLALFVVACFCLLFLQLNNWQVRQASSLQASPLDKITPDAFLQPRGDIVAADGTVLAYSEPTKDQYQEQRVYPLGPLFAPITGYYDVVQRAETQGIEVEYDGYLLEHQSSPRTAGQVLTQHQGTDTVVLTVDKSLQQVAATALAGKIGAVVAIDPRTGAILALYGNPTFDPNKLASHDAKAVVNYFNSLNPNSGASPLVNYATAQTTAPGSTFKVITTATAFDHDPTELQKVWPVLSSTPLPETDRQLQNFGGESCGGPLAVILAKSCDTAYALMGVDLGAPSLAAEAKAFGFNQVPPLDLPTGEVAPSCFPPVDRPAKVAGCPAAAPIGEANKPGIAYSAIGQEDVSESALQDALVAAGIANGGTIMTPHLLSHVVDDQGSIVTRFQPKPWTQATTPATANAVRSLMRGVVESGTASPVGFPASLHVAAKTGTAETGLVNCSSTWLIATAPADPGDTPKIAVAAVVPAAAGIGCGETGAEVAGPIVKAVVDAYLGAGS